MLDGTGRASSGGGWVGCCQLFSFLCGGYGGFVDGLVVLFSLADGPTGGAFVWREGDG